MGENKFIGSLILIALFALSIVSYSFYFMIDNESPIDFSQYGLRQLNTSVIGNLSEFKDTSNTSSEAFFKSTIESGDETTVSGGQFKGGLISMAKSVGIILGALNEILFGGNVAFGIFFTTLSSFLVFMGVRFIWQTWKGGRA